MTDKAVAGAGDVVIKLVTGKDEELVEHILKPTLRAAQIMSSQSGGIMGAIRRCQELELATIVLTIQCGLSLTPHGAKGLDERVFKTGFADRGAEEAGLATNCIRYLAILSNGGRPIGEGREDENPPTET